MLLCVVHQKTDNFMALPTFEIGQRNIGEYYPQKAFRFSPRIISVSKLIAPAKKIMRSLVHGSELYFETLEEILVLQSVLHFHYQTEGTSTRTRG